MLLFTLTVQKYKLTNSVSLKNRTFLFSKFVKLSDELVTSLLILRKKISPPRCQRSMSTFVNLGQYFVNVFMSVYHEINYVMRNV